MKKNLILLLSFLFLAACASTVNPWDRPVYTQEAQSAPRDLSLPGEQQTEWQTQSAGVYLPTAPPPDAVLTAAIPGAEDRTHYDSYGAYKSYDAAPSDSSVMAAAPALPAVKVALLVPLSGPQADLGQALLQAAQLALFDMDYGAFELIPRDTAGTPAGARAAAQGAAENGAQLILGPVFADSVRAAKPVASRYNIPMVAFSTDWTLAGGNTYVMGFLPFAQVQRVVQYAATQGLGRIGVLIPDDSYGNAVGAAYQAAAMRAGIETVAFTRYPVGQTDISTLVRQFTRYDSRLDPETGDPDPTAPIPFDAVLMPSGGGQAQAVANLLSYYDLGPRKVRRLGTGLWDDNSVLTEPNLAGGWFAAPAPEARASFESRYKDTYGRLPPRLATLSYDATALAAVLARNSYYRTGQVSFDYYAMTNPNGFSGLDGVFRFRPDGLVERGLAVLEVRGSQLRVVDPAPRTFQSATMP